MTLPISEYPYRYPESTVIVVGKGPSIVDSDHYDACPCISCNEAVYYTGRGIFTRFDTEPPGDFGFCANLPDGVDAIIPSHLQGLYYPAWYFEPEDLLLKQPAPTVVQAVCIANYLGASEIVMCGFDALEYNDFSYYGRVSNPRNRNWKTDQKPQFRYLVPPAILAKCRFHSGTTLLSALYKRQK